MKPNLRIVYDDKLVTTYWDADKKQIFRQGKRVSEDCPLNDLERRTYVAFGLARALRQIRDGRGCTLNKAWELITVARGYHNADNET